MTERTQHYLLTVFNVGLYASERADLSGRVVSETSEAWMAHRLELFDRYCFPSVVRQTCQDFTWLVFVDADTPDYQRAVLGCYEAYPNLRILSAPRGALTKERRVFGPEAIAAMAAPETDAVITSRLDNDDALHRDYMALARAEIPRRHRAMLAFPRGLCLDRTRLFVRHYPLNPFPSMIERPDRSRPDLGLVTVWGGEHDKMAEFAREFRHLETGPMWLQVVHERNLLNRPKGDEVPFCRQTLAPFLPETVLDDLEGAAGRIGAERPVGTASQGSLP